MHAARLCTSVQPYLPGQHLVGAVGLARGLKSGGGCRGGERLGRHEGLVGGHAQLLQRVRKEADLARALLAIVAQLRAVARRVQPVLEHIVRVGAGVPPRAALVLEKQQGAHLSPASHHSGWSHGANSFWHARNQLCAKPLPTPTVACHGTIGVGKNLLG